jgi:hypothetical protein
MAQAATIRSINARAPKDAAQYLTPLGFTDKRPATYPPCNRAAVMRNAHRIAKLQRAHFATYREALAYGLSAAWRQDRSNRNVQALALQVSRPTLDTQPIAKLSRRLGMLGSYSYAGT